MARRSKKHPFEAAGLGVAPFRVIGLVERFRIVSPGVPPERTGRCDYCGEPLRHCYRVRDSAGREFEVGVSCLKGLWHEDPRLAKGAEQALRAVGRAEREAQRQATRAQELERIAAALAALEADLALLAGEPDPRPLFARRGRTLRHYAITMLKLASHPTRFQAAKLVEKRLPRTTGEA